jgi:hypothetical protein
MNATLRAYCTAAIVGIVWLGAVQTDDLRAADVEEARALLAMPVSFGADTAAKLSSSVLTLLARCTVVRPANMAEWNDIQRQCHLRVKYDGAHHMPLTKPLPDVAEAKSLEIDELIVTLPLSSGRVYVRSGDKVYWFAKWPGSETDRLCKPIQTLLSSHD